MSHHFILHHPLYKSAFTLYAYGKHSVKSVNQSIACLARVHSDRTGLNCTQIFLFSSVQFISVALHKKRRRG